MLASIAGGLVALTLLAVFLTLLTSTPYRTSSSAMEPTLHCLKPAEGCEAATFPDRVLASRLLYRLRDPHRGDLVAFKIPPAAKAACGGGVSGTFIKRLIGLPGDRWREQAGYIYLNGERQTEPYIEPDRRDSAIPEKTVPKAQYLMLGDNRASSCDSRRWGTVPRKNLVGPVFAVYWPPSRIGFR